MFCSTTKGVPLSATLCDRRGSFFNSNANRQSGSPITMSGVRVFAESSRFRPVPTKTVHHKSLLFYVKGRSKKSYSAVQVSFLPSLSLFISTSDSPCRCPLVFLFFETEEKRHRLLRWPFTTASKDAMLDGNNRKATASIDGSGSKGGSIAEMRLNNLLVFCAQILLGLLVAPFTRLEVV